MTTQEDNKAVVHDFIEALFTKGDLSAVDRYLAAGFVAHDAPMPGASGDAAGFRGTAMQVRAAFPDWHSDLHLLLAEGDYVVEQFTASGTHRGEFMGAAPTNRAVAVPGINIFRVRDGQIVERWGNLDVLGFLTQLGVVAVPART
ncbi:MAG TPA: ester cyclase [Acidimicrobiales bacterium]|nr:ester cyclase [Acidimicrobiales bacterium]